jgi:hypothetical protein
MDNAFDGTAAIRVVMLFPTLIKLLAAIESLLSIVFSPSLKVKIGVDLMADTPICSSGDNLNGF